MSGKARVTVTVSTPFLFMILFSLAACQDEYKGVICDLTSYANTSTIHVKECGYKSVTICRGDCRAVQCEDETKQVNDQYKIATLAETYLCGNRYPTEGDKSTDFLRQNCKLDKDDRYLSHGRPHLMEKQVVMETCQVQERSRCRKRTYSNPQCNKVQVPECKIKKVTSTENYAENPDCYYYDNTSTNNYNNRKDNNNNNQQQQQQPQQGIDLVGLAGEGLKLILGGLNNQG